MDLFYFIILLIQLFLQIQIILSDKFLLSNSTNSMYKNNFYTNSNIDISTCQKLVTNHGYGYKHFFEISQLKHHSSKYLVDLHFAVQAPRDAHILLTPSADLAANGPVYEIVLGAGLNTFSDIRRQKRGQTKSTSKTMELLSIHEMKSFWLHVSTDGLIEVGEEGEEVAFISWHDPDPIPVRYVSFGTWSNVEASWRFDCRLKPSTMTNENSTMVNGDIITETPENLTAIQKLRRDLFSYYDPYVIPVMSPVDEKLVLLINIKNVQIINVDETESTLTAKAIGDLKWYDHKLKWTPDAYENITSVKIRHRLIWVPELFLYNAYGFSNELLESGLITIWHNGLVQWSPKLTMKVWLTNVESFRWPYDTRIAEFHLGLWSQASLITISGNSSIAKDGVFKHFAEWLVLNGTFNFFKEVYTPWIRLSGGEDHDTSLLILQLVLRRNYPGLGLIYFSVFCVIGISMILTSFVSTIKFSKISIICFQLLLITVLMLFLGIKVPPSGTTPKIVLFCTFGQIASCVLLLVSLVTMRIAQTEHSKPLPQGLCKFLTSTPVQMIFFLPSTKDYKTYGQFKNTDTDETEGRNLEIKDIWFSFSVFIDRIVFLIYSIGLSVVCLEHF